MKARPWFGLLLVGALALGFAFLVFPVVAIFFHTAPSELISSLGDEASTEALRLSLETSAIAMAAVVAVGTPAAYWLATRVFKAKPVLVAMLELPLVLPPAVAGLGLLAALGPNGILGPALADAHVQLVLQTSGVVVALCFVSGPLYLLQAQAAFGTVERSLMDASRTLGAGEAATFARVAIPVALPGLLTGRGDRHLHHRRRRARACRPAGVPAAGRRDHTRLGALAGHRRRLARVRVMEGDRHAPERALRRRRWQTSAASVRFRRRATGVPAMGSRRRLS
jgi:molybdate transport system permease protein